MTPSEGVLYFERIYKDIQFILTLSTGTESINEGGRV